MANTSNPQDVPNTPSDAGGGLPEWGASPSKMEGKRAPAPRRRRRWPKLIAGGVVLLLIVAGLLVGFAPAIASAMAPGYIEAAAAKSINGRVKVADLSLSWGGPLKIGPVELYDDKGALVGAAETTLSAGLWKIVSEQWWSRKQLDIGVAEVTGKLDVVRGMDGTSNLERALRARTRAPSSQAPPGPAQPSGAPGEPAFESIKGVIKLSGMDVTYTDKQAAAGTPMAAGVGVAKFGGDVNLNYNAKGGNSTATADLTGDLKGVGTGTDKLTLTADVLLKQDAKGVIENMDAKVDLLGAPLGLVDGIAGLGGELVRSIGARGDVRVRAQGTPDKATATLNVVAEGANADLAFDYTDGVLSTTKPGTVKVRSTTFVGELPALRETMARLAESVRLDTGPSLDVTIASLSIPVPKSALGLAPGDAKAPAKIDIRSAAMDVGVVVGAQRGVVNTANLGGAPAEGAGAAGEEGGFEAFGVDPIVINFSTPRLADAKHLTASTQATIGGKPAGRLAVDLTASGLFDATGSFDAGALERAGGEAKLLGVTTALLQPLVDAAGVKVDLAQDVGPTLDVVVRPTTTEAPQDGKLPATNINMAITSANVRGGGDVRFDNGVVTTTGEGIVVDVLSAGPLVARMMSPAPGAGAPAAVVSGKLPVRATLRDVGIDTGKKPFTLGDMRGRAEVRASEGSIALNLAKPEPGQPAPGPVAPVSVARALLTAVLVPGQTPAVGIDAAMSHENNPFSVKGNFTAPGLTAAAPAGGAKGPIDKLLGMKVAGRLDVIDLPRSLAKLVPAADAALNPTGADGTAEIKRLVAGLIGPNLDITLTTEAVDGAQRAKIDLAGAGLTATTSASVTPAGVDVSGLGAQARIVPAQSVGVLTAFTPRSVPVGGGPAPAFVPMSLGDAVTIMASAEPLRIPFKAGTSELDMEKIGEAALRVTTDKPVLISNIPAGAGREAVGLGSLVATARLPVGAYLAETSAAPAVLNARVTTEVLRPAGGATAWNAPASAQVAAKAEIDAAVPMKNKAAEKRFGVRLTDIDAVALSPLTGDPLLLPGTLGDRVQLTANATVSGTPETGQRIGIQATVEAPRLKGASIQGSTQGDVFRVDAAKLAWTPSVDWFNRTVFAAAPGAPGGAADQLAEEATFTLDVKSLAVSMPKAENGVAVQGPMKPGVFNADVSLASPRAVVRRADGKVVQAENIRVALLGGQKPGSVSIDAGIGRITGEGGAAASRPSSIRGTIDNIADQNGVLTTPNALVNLTGDLDTFPTALIDSLAGMNGKVVDLLGSTLNLDLTVNNFSRTVDGGVVTAQASSPRAGARLKGVVRDATFIQDGAFEVDIFEMLRYEMAKKLPGGMPLVAVIEKQKGVDDPAVIRAQGLRVPIDNDMRKLNGVISVDPGTATFEVNDAFSKILRRLSQKDSGQMGQHLDPFVVNITDGVARYDKFKLKFGEFTLETSGAADLVQKRVDIVTYIPAGAVTEEILNIFKGTLGANAKGFTADTRFPFTTKGPLDNPKTEPDLGLFIKESAGNLIEDVKNKALEDLFKKLKGDK